MKWIATKNNRRRYVILVFTLFSLFASNAFGQPNNEQKLAQARVAFEEEKKLENRETSKSYEEALAKFQTASRLYKEIGDKNGEGKALFETGLMFHKLGKLGGALENYKQAYTLFDATSNLLERAKTVNYIGTIYSLLGNKKLAFDFYNTSLRMFFELDAFFEAIPTINNVGSIYQEFGDTENALFYFNLALPHVRLMNDKGSEGMILINIGDIYSDTGDYEKASEYFKKSIPLHQAAKNENGEVRALYQLGVVSYRANKKGDSINYFNQALALNGSRFKNEEALTLQYLIYAWKDSGNMEIAVFFGKQGVNKYQELRKGIQILDVQTQKIFLRSIENTYRQLADLLIAQGQLAQAEQVLRMLKEEEYFDFVRRDRSETNSLDERVSLSEKEKDLLKRYVDLANQVSKPEREMAELEKRKNSLSNIEQKRFADLKIELETAKSNLKNFLEKDLINAFGKPTKEGIEYDRKLQEKLREWGEGTVILYTVVANDRYRVILTTPEKQIDGKTEISAIELNKKVFAYRKALQNIETDPRPLGKELYDILIKPIEKELVAADAKTLVWSLDETLRYIPISTLSPDGKSYLIEKYRSVITTPQTRDDVSDLDMEWRALGVGVSESQTVKSPENPEEEIEFSPLPGSKEELLTIIDDEEIQDDKGILSGRRFMDKDFTINSLAESLGAKNARSKRKFTAVHIASHFQLGSNWANSFLLLGNGQVLTLKELKNSPEYNFGDVELVTLSACDTAFTADSNGKEVDSLASVIQAKKGKAVLAALRAVVDESTPLLMSEFYRLRKANPKMTKAEAMQIVQKEFIAGKLKPSDEYIEKLNEYLNSENSSSNKDAFKFDKNAPFAHPYFWSPFVLIGNWR